MLADRLGRGGGVVGAEEDPYAAGPEQWGGIVELLGPAGLEDVATVLVDEVGAVGAAAEQREWPVTQGPRSRRANDVASLSQWNMYAAPPRTTASCARTSRTSPTGMGTAAIALSHRPAARRSAIPAVAPCRVA